MLPFRLGLTPYILQYGEDMIGSKPRLKMIYEAGFLHLWPTYKGLLVTAVKTVIKCLCWKVCAVFLSKCDGHILAIQSCKRVECGGDEENLNVEAAGGDVGGDEDGRLALPKAIKCLEALALLH